MLFALVVIALAGSSLVTGSVQNPTLTSCSSSDEVKVSDVSITNAKIGQTMVIKFTVTISESLGSDPTVQLTLKDKDGSEIPCIGDVGSCSYKLCGGTSDIEQKLGQQWNNQCPVPATTGQESLSFKLDPQIEIVIGNAPTTVNVQLEVTNEGTTVGCQSFSINIEDA